MKILVTGCAGFIGFHLSLSLLTRKNDTIVGIDNLNSYYDINLKTKRLNRLLLKKNFIFKKINISNKLEIKKIFKKYNFDKVIHLAAQAGVRYSIKYPDNYIKTNINGFYNLLKESKENNIKHFLFASSSSVYGENKTFPLIENLKTEEPLSLYAATKKSNELIAYSFSNLYKLPITGMRFFTVYGPYGRPDMAIYKFVDLILKNKQIELFNYGNNYRDYTFIDDVVISIKKLAAVIPDKSLPYIVVNIGNDKPIKTIKLVNIISKALKTKPLIKLSKPAQGDVVMTHADIAKLKNLTKYKPKVNLELGIRRFINWYKDYNKFI